MNDSSLGTSPASPGVLVVGGSGSLGSTLVPILIEAGLSVIVSTRQGARLTLVDTATVVEADPSREEGLRRIVEACAAASTRVIGVVFLNGAFAMDQGVGTTAFADNLRRLLQANLLPAADVLTRFLPILAQSHSSRVVFISAESVESPFVGGAAYAISKGAVESLARQVDLEYGASGVKSTVLRPGVIGAESHEVSPEELSATILQELQDCVEQNTSTRIAQGA